MQVNFGLIHALRHHGLDYKILLEADQFAQRSKQPLLPYLITQSITDTQFIANACANFFGLEYFDLYQINSADISLDILNINLIKDYWLLPLSKQAGSLNIAICDPRSFAIIESIEFQTGLKIKLYISNFEQQLKIINHLISKQLFKSFYQENLNTSSNKILLSESEVSITSFVDQIISHAIHQNASDIHFEPYAKNFVVRLRIDGLLHKMLDFPLDYINTISSRLKILSNLDIAEHRRPQDGRFQFTSTLGLLRDCRTSTCPTINGEKIVVRILDTQSQLLQISQLGMTELQQTIFLHALKQTQGLILVTGPTGSGKSITLYAALQYCYNGSNNITTIENPVEIQLNDINQINVNYNISLDFATALRTILRQDPDIIMIGEIRDEETANMAIRAAQTGHLVLATLHTNDALEAITRLQNLGVTNHDIANCLKLIIAQRLVRKRCIYCKNISEKIDYSCSHCHQGYSGRIGIYEALSIDSALQESIITNNIITFRKDSNFINLYSSAQKLVNAGMTTQMEIERVLGALSC